MLYTTKQVAKILGVDDSRVRVLAQSRGVGIKLGSGAWVFTEQDIENMKDRKPGRPGATTTKPEPG